MRNAYPSSPERLRENLAQITELLAIFRREEALRAAGDPEQPKPAVHNTLPELRDRLSRMHTADVAQVLELLPPEDRLLAWRQLREQRGGALLREVGETVRGALIGQLGEEELRLAIGQLDADALSALADQLPPALLQERLLALPDTERRWLEGAMAWHEDSVGDLMSSEMVVVPDHLSVEQLLTTLRSRSALPIHTDKIFVTDQQGVLRGVVPLATLLLSAPAVPVSEVMAAEVVSFTPGEEASDAAQAFARYDLVSAPVVDEQGRLLGRLTVDVVMEFVRDEGSEEVLNFAGLRGEEDLFASPWNSARNRWLWLTINLLTAFIASRVIGLFEATIVQLVALAALMPIVASIGGNSGNQTTALVIRALALDQLNGVNLFHLLRKELGVSLLNGGVLGVVVGGFAYAIYGSAPLAGVIAAAILLNLLIAALAGIVVPLLLERLGRDPALGSSILLTATTDSLGFFIFLGLASLFLL